ncbi:F-box protein [Phanerochaete sordida]|uniref:F-box protein n=1 Tax=Phanerochaete sordida TaxID=48140 RepID=A0A9P3LBM3_9APHY|nr:F-box protein [Phanerochaete sordida]
MQVPDELLLLIVSYFPLPTLIRARGVCRLWRSVIPGSHLPAFRRGLLELYLRLLASPVFAPTRKAVLAQRCYWSRAAYLAQLPPALPADFRAWVTEWPERALLGLVWPGLRHARNMFSEADLLGDTGTCILPIAILNSVAFHTPEPCMMQAYMYAPAARADAGVALLIDDAFIDGYQRSRILLLSGACKGADMAGRVYQVAGVKGAMDVPLAKSWTEYLNQELSRQEQWFRGHQC